MKMKIDTIMVGEMGVNCYLVYCEETREAIAIDPGDDVNKIIAKIAAKELKLKYIVNTHGHADHIGANNELKKVTQAQILIHVADAPMLSDPKLNLSLFIGEPIISGQADIILKDGDTIAIGNEKLSVLHTPGHSAGGICLLGKQFLFSGDTLFAESVGRCDFPGGSMAELLNSIKNKLMVLEDQVKVFPGHGTSTSIGWERDHNPYINRN